MHEQTQRYFDDNSDYWREIYADTNAYTGYSLRKQHDFVLQRIAAMPDVGRVLDVGCGAGITIGALAEQGYAAYGMDIAAQMVHRAQQHTAACFQQANAEKLPYATARFDAVVALGLVSNVPDDAAAWGEIRRVLKLGGVFIVSVANVIALDVIFALPMSLPIMLNTTPLRKPARQTANLVRRALRRPPKDADAIRFGRSVLPPRYARRIASYGFAGLQYQALTLGPVRPFGLKLFDTPRLIQISERGHQILPDMFGSVVIYTGYRV